MYAIWGELSEWFKVRLSKSRVANTHRGFESLALRFAAGWIPTGFFITQEVGMISNNIDSIIFDVDGTLWDSTEVVAIGYNRALETYTDLPVRVDGARLMKLFGKPMDQIFAELLPELSAEQQHYISEKCVILEEEELEKADPKPLLYPGIEEMFQKLSEKLPLFIVSNCQCGYIEQFLRKNHFESYITDHLCFGQTGTSKGQTILRLMKENHLKAPVYVGDTLGDANACKEAGIPFILAEYGFGEVADPDASIQKPLDLVHLFANKNL